MSTLTLTRRRGLAAAGWLGPVARRLGAGVAVLWAAATAAYVALLLVPGDTVDVLIGDGLDTPERRAQIIAEWGLDRSALQQYGDYLTRLLHGDLGHSYILQRGVGEILSSQIGPTVRLALTAAAFGVALALVLALVTAGRRSWLSGLAGLSELVAVSVPPFMLGILLLVVFSFTLGWFPVSGDRGFVSLVLPAVALGLQIAGVLGQVLREGLERALEEPFAVTARSRGITEWRLVTRHALRHALLPAVTLTGWFTGVLLGGAIVVEAVFGRPGLGQVTVSAVTGKDMPVVMAVVLLSALIYVTVSTVVDLAYLAIDPRLRRSR
ncbi:ABC transporter permease [Streptosporangium roseum]|uniref:Dipeptide ABC transporter n=1 Tax=Streptosporangium roseum (strain ATCC 12428 / DSM 43021 / JCM 3005 / KCTC 9067 / NCIMB 10171 / NRRL 2505 / NI 9100) TaxID=479432 RepID=D2B198_STRRD|nr:ABC transporter permease [Streptosporangium roseum]ACZ85363.1 dipeptide ABC transporter [Streptosporangium roseum DSM 43021]